MLVNPVKYALVIDLKLTQSKVKLCYTIWRVDMMISNVISLPEQSKC